MLMTQEKSQRREEVEYIEQCKDEEQKAKDKLKEKKFAKFEEMQMLLTHAKEV